MEEIKENEQWKLDGDCDKCRRVKFCSKECTVRRKRVDQEMMEFIERRTGISALRGIMRNNFPW